MSDVKTIGGVERFPGSRPANISGRNIKERPHEGTVRDLNITRGRNQDSQWATGFEDLLIDLMNKYAIPQEHEVELRSEIMRSVRKFKQKRVLDVLPKAPRRDYQARESIIEYIRSPEGLGPWLRAGQLSRPLLRKLSPRAYTALANWLRHPDHSLEAEGLSIPTKSELVERRQSDPLLVKEAERISSANYRRRKKAGASKTRAGG